MLEKPSKDLDMSAIVEASILIRQVAEPRPVGDSVKAAIVRASRRLGFGFSRTKTIWYGEAFRINAEEMDVLRKAAKRRHVEQIARAEASVVLDRMVALRAAMATADADFHKPLLDALDESIRAMGGSVCAVDLREE
jgi:hypothetical protein